MGWAPAAAPIGCAAAPFPRRVPNATRPARSCAQPRSWFPQEGGRAGAGPISPPPSRPQPRWDKTQAAARENPGSGFHPVAERRGRVPFAARAPAPRTQLRERGSPRADTRQPERRGSIFSRAMNGARENLPEPAETFSAPGVAAAAAAA